MLVTSNRGKYEEYRMMFEAEGIGLELNMMSYPEEQLDSIEKVAERSAYYLTGIVGPDFFIDDSGLFIESLGGFPGVYSSYVKRTIGNEGILKLMKGVENRKAEFRTCIAFYNGKLNLFTGRVSGSISEEQRGKGGFGFDPIFIPDGLDRTYAEMTTAEKNSISHRAVAARNFLLFLKNKDNIDL